MNPPTEPPPFPPLTPFDYKLITNVLEPLMQKIQRLTGLDCFFWSKVCLWITLICVIPSILVCGALISNAGSGFILLVNIVLCYDEYATFDMAKQGLFSSTIGVDALRKMAYEALGRGERNPLVLKWRLIFFNAVLAILAFFIVVLYPLSVLLAYFILATPFLIGYLAQALSSCTPLPPQQKKSGVRRSGVIDKRSTAPSGIPVPEAS